MKSIDIDLDVYKAIVANQHDFDETPNAVLRRLLGVEPDDAAGATTEPPEHLVAPHPPEHRAPAAEVRSDDRPTGDLVDKSRGLMVGVAVGNLLGIPYEGGRWNRARIVAEFPDGIREIAAKPGWPDDDDLAQSILLAEASIATDAYDINDLARRFWKWGELNGAGMGGQTRHALRLFGGAEPRRELRQYARFGTPTGLPPRAPSGCAAIDAPRMAWEETGSAAAGNGAAMRCAPVALRWLDDEEAVVRNSVVSAAVTHWDPRCLWSAVLINLAIVRCLRSELVNSNELTATADEIAHGLRDELHPYPLGHRMPSKVRESAEAALRTGAIVEDLGIDHRNAGYTLIALRAALWGARHAANFEGGLSAIVSAGGDTDTNGAIAGAVLGARFGHHAIPARWRDHVAEIRHYTPPVANWPHRERLEDLADRVLASRQPNQTTPVRRTHPKRTLQIQGVAYHYRNAKEALCIVLQQLQKRDPAFLARLARHPQCIGRNRRTLAQRREELYTSQDAAFLTKHSVEVVDGWFLGTNTNTPHTKETIRAAADVAGLKLGQDIVVDL